MDFFTIARKDDPKTGEVEAYPSFVIGDSKDLLVRGQSFHAIWDEAVGLWSRSEFDVQRLVDEVLYEQGEQMGATHFRTMRNFGSKSWSDYQRFIKSMPDTMPGNQLDEELTFQDQPVTREDFASKRVQYALSDEFPEAWNEIVGTLYDDEERAKIEWAIGAIVAGDGKRIQKFVVFYGPAGSGKSTILSIIQMLFEGYYTTFEAKALVGNNNSFATEVFKANPLVAIQHDGDLSNIMDNSKLNSIVSHEDMTMNEKYKASYTSRINAFLFMGTNKEIKITDAKSGLIRRLIDVSADGKSKIPQDRYTILMERVHFELGAIANHCLKTYRAMGKKYYDRHNPIKMRMKTDHVYNFIESQFDLFKMQNGTTLEAAYKAYKLYCEDTQIERPLSRMRFQGELENYFEDFYPQTVIDGTPVHSWFDQFDIEQFRSHLTPPTKEAPPVSLVLDQTESSVDILLSGFKAQYASESGAPSQKWDNVTTTLAELDTTKLHYVMVPENHIVIDFDLTDEDGNKSAERNIEAASKWPPTYAEYSKGGGGIHLHYNYDGDVTQLASAYSEGIEVKTLLGHSSLRRRLSLCNNVPVATISTGLPLKEKKLITSEQMKGELSVRKLIERNLRKEFHPGTKPSMDFIKKILDDAYKSDMVYDVSDMKQRILVFAMSSSNQADVCIKMIETMKFKSEDKEKEIEKVDESPIVVFDVEVFPNLFIICWKAVGSEAVVTMVNPSPQEVEELMKRKLVGFNCRRYDNHILYARAMGYSNLDLYKLSKKIIEKAPNAMFGEAYNVSYADIYDYSSVKQSLKKFEIDLGLPHKEWGGGWDDPVPEDQWLEVAEYCANDVNATEAVFLDRQADFNARLILAELSGLAVNSSTQQHTARIIFGKDANPQSKFIYTDLSTKFPGYTYDMGKSQYRGIDPSEGGYVYAEPGMYENVAVLDVASMHPTSIEILEAFGPYTAAYSAIKQTRIFIKNGDFESARKMMDGRLAPYLQNEDDAENLSYALKIVINIVYGLTSAKFDNKFRDPRNKDNIVAKHGALFMIDLQHYVQEQGYQVVHIKTDSIKIPNATPEIIEKVMEFGRQYGYDFEHEATYEKFCLVDKAQYIAYVKAGKKPAHWTATGAQFQHPYVFKTLFSREEIKFEDLCETKQVMKGEIYMNFYTEDAMFKEQPAPRFVGRIGSFVPIKPECGGAVLLVKRDDKMSAVAGTRGYFWLEAEMVRDHREKDIDMTYFETLVYKAKEQLAKYGDAHWFVG